MENAIRLGELAHDKIIEGNIRRCSLFAAPDKQSNAAAGIAGIGVGSDLLAIDI